MTRSILNIVFAMRLWVTIPVFSTTIESVVKDFLIADPVVRCNHYEPAVAYADDSSLISAWLDMRKSDYRIFVNVCDADGNLNIPDFEASEDVNCRNPAIVTSDSVFVVAWTSEKRFIHLACFSLTDGTLLWESDPQGRLFDSFDSLNKVRLTKVNTDIFAAAWYEPPKKRSRVQLFNFKGDPVSEPTDLPDAKADIACLSNGDILCFQILDGIFMVSGLDSNFQKKFDPVSISSSFSSVSQFCSAGCGDRAVVLVTAKKPGETKDNVFYMSVDSLGITLLEPVQVSGQFNVTHGNPALTVHDSLIAAVWCDSREYDRNIYLQYLNPQGEKVGNSERIDGGFEPPEQLNPAVAFSADGSTTAVLWEDYRSGNVDIMAESFPTFHPESAETFRVNRDEHTGQQRNCQIEVDASGNMTVAWTEQAPETQGPQIWVARLNSSGELIKGPFPICEEINAGSFSMDGNSYGQTAFAGGKSYPREQERADIVVHFFDENLTQIGEKYVISRYDQTIESFDPQVALNDSGQCVVAWTDTGSTNICVTELTINGEFHRSQFKIVEEVSRPVIFKPPKIALNNNGKYCVMWLNFYDIWAQLLDFDEPPAIPNLQINAEQPFSSNPYANIISTQDGYAIAWMKSYGNRFSLHTRRLGRDGQLADEIIRVDDSRIAVEDEFYWRVPLAVTEDNRCLLAWADLLNNDWNLYGRFIDFDSGEQPDIYTLPCESPEYSQKSPEIAIHGDLVYTVWIDKREGNEKIYANIWRVNSSDVSDTEIIPESVTLYPNYPNPFNPATAIRLDLPKESEISLTVYDMRGRRVRTLFEGRLVAGAHQIVWNAQDDLGQKVSSGVYFCKMEADKHRAVRKMILMK